MLVLSIGVYKLIQKRNDKRRKEAFFKRNGGLLLHQQTSNGEHASETTRLFSATELDKATDKYGLKFLHPQTLQQALHYPGSIVFG